MLAAVCPLDAPFLMLRADFTLMRWRCAPASQGGECCRPGSASQSWRVPARCRSCARSGRPARTLELRTRVRCGREFCSCYGSLSIAHSIADGCEWRTAPAFREVSHRGLARCCVTMYYKASHLKGERSNGKPSDGNP